MEFIQVNTAIFRKRLYLFLEKILSYFTRKFISVSESEAVSVISSGITDRNKLVIIPNGTYIPEKPNLFDFGKSEYRIVTTTRFDFAKNTGMLIPIAEELIKLQADRNFRFVVLGKGEEEEEFKHLLQEKRLEKYFDMKGFVLSTGDYLKEAFCYISTSRWEGLPLGVLEAMSYGIPVIASNVNGNKDLVSDGVNGYLFEINEPRKAAEIIIKLAGSPDNYKKLSLNSRSIAEKKFSLDIMAEKTLQLYLALK
jgi:glycosyltransferase involved in cell wall biosynthesis